MSEGYRKQYQKQNIYMGRSFKDNEFIGTAQKPIPRSQDNINIQMNQKSWMGQLSGTKKIVQSKIQTPKQVEKPQQQQMLSRQRQSKLGSFSRQTNSNNNQSPMGKFSNNLSRASTAQRQQKTPTQLMNDIFRSIGINHLLNQKPYYSKESQDLLCEILSNKNKLTAYTKKLNTEMQQMPPQVQKNYQVLLTLLQQLSQSDLEIHQDQNGIRILFNRSQLLEKQKQLEKLQKELQQKNKQTQKIVAQYESVIRNFNDVIQKLVQEKKY